MIEIDFVRILIIVAVWAPILLFNGWLTIKLYKRRQAKKEEKFLKYLRVRYPTARIELHSFASSDEEALASIKKRLDEQQFTRLAPHDGLLAVKYTDENEKTLILPPDRVVFLYETDGI